MSASPPIPLVLLIGFLGAGKTTLLRQLLPLLRAQGLSPHVILNDYRNAQVDAHQLEGLAEHVEPISGSCVCCDSRDDLLDTFARMELSSNGVVLLEANGTADAQELIEILTADRRTRRFTLPIQVSVVDAKRWQKRYWNNGMEAGQIRTASSIVLTRVEEVDSKRLAEVKADLACRNPRALLQDAEALAVQLGALLRRRDQLPPRRFAPPVIGGRLPTAHHAHGAHHFASMEIPLTCRVTEEALEAFLRALPPEVIRAKGVAFLSGEPLSAVLFQKIEGRDRPAIIDLPRPERLDPVAVLIGVHCPRDDIMKLASEHLGVSPALEHESPPP